MVRARRRRARRPLPAPAPMGAPLRGAAVRVAARATSASSPTSTASSTTTSSSSTRSAGTSSRRRSSAAFGLVQLRKLPHNLERRQAQLRPARRALRAVPRRLRAAAHARGPRHRLAHVPGAVPARVGPAPRRVPAVHGGPRRSTPAWCGPATRCASPRSRASHTGSPPAACPNADRVMEQGLILPVEPRPRRRRRRLHLRHARRLPETREDPMTTQPTTDHARRGTPARRRPLHPDLGRLPRRREPRDVPHLPRGALPRRLRRVARRSTRTRSATCRATAAAATGTTSGASASRRRTAASSPRSSSPTPSRRSSRPRCTSPARRCPTSTSTASPASVPTTGGSSTSAPTYPERRAGHRPDLPQRPRRRDRRRPLDQGARPARRDPPAVGAARRHPHHRPALLELATTSCGRSARTSTSSSTSTPAPARPTTAPSRPAVSSGSPRPRSSRSAR